MYGLWMCVARSTRWYACFMFLRNLFMIHDELVWMLMKNFPEIHFDPPKPLPCVSFVFVDNAFLIGSWGLHAARIIGQARSWLRLTASTLMKRLRFMCWRLNFKILLINPFYFILKCYIPFHFIFLKFISNPILIQMTWEFLHCSPYCF